MLLVPPPLLFAPSSIGEVVSDFPTRSLTTKAFTENVGYAAVGGVTSIFIVGEAGGGTLSGQMVVGYANDGLIQILDPEEGSAIQLVFVGNAASVLSAVTSLRIDSTLCLIAIPFTYDEGLNITHAVFDSAGITMTAPTTYSVQLIGEMGAPPTLLNAASFSDGAAAGYIIAGGVLADNLGTSGGSLSNQLLAGYVTEGIIQQYGGTITLYLRGNAVSALSGVTSLRINSTLCLIAAPFTYEEGLDITVVVFDGSSVAIPPDVSVEVKLV